MVVRAKDLSCKVKATERTLRERYIALAHHFAVITVPIVRAAVLATPQTLAAVTATPMVRATETSLENNLDAVIASPIVMLLFYPKPQHGKP